MLNRRTLIFNGGLAALLGVPVGLAAQGGESVRTLFEGKLANAPGSTLTAEVVDYPPGAKSTLHHHAGSVFAYVLAGRIRSHNSAAGAVRVYKAGETFFEPAGSDHLISENASEGEPASLLAIHIADDAAVLTRPGRAK
jgi:quercetin dioxygenase-like cupin family protein